MAFWCRVKQSRLHLLHQFRRLHSQSSQGFTCHIGPLIVLPRVVVGISDWRISRRPTEFCDNARFFAAPFQPKQKEDKDTSGPRLNEKITGDVVRLVISEDEHTIISLKEAFQRAQRLGMDLVEVNRKADPPVCKIMDFHKEQYVKKLKEKEVSKSKTKIKSAECKEVRITPKIEQKDLEMKAKNAIRSMESGYRVKCAVSGKENEDVGGTLARLCALLEDVSIVESGPRVDKKQAYVVVRHVKFGPSKSGGAKKISHISADAFTSPPNAVAEESGNSKHESNQNVTDDSNEYITTSSEPSFPESGRTKPSPLPPQPSAVNEDRYKKNNKNKFMQTKPADGVRPPAQPPNNSSSTMRHGTDDTTVRSPRSSPKELPMPQSIHEPPKPATSFGIFSNAKTNPQGQRSESDNKRHNDRRPPTTGSEPKPEKTFGIFSKR
uniref:Translation initiation factor IF-3 n=1 Tax=Kalanchoe fedtschenkoi TaxID=63787 RepID=A0A7N0U521_KALFE